MKRALGLTLLLVLLFTTPLVAGELTLEIDTPQAPPNWAVLQRHLLAANAEACRVFFDRYFDRRGYLRCVERWGGDDGPDDAIENVNDWPVLHALGGNDSILQMYRHAWEGHLRQYTEAKTVEVPFAREGMYYKEFPVMFDWVHNGEGLTVFNLQGLSDPLNRAFQRRVKRFAGFYMNEDPGAKNYDPKHRIIRSLFNGSRGPLLRKATGLDWAGDPIRVKNRFRPRHGEETYQQMVEHFKDYNDIIGDHPQNLLATSLALNAYMLTGEAKYRRWLLEYVDAWNERLRANGDIIPTNIGLDGKVGSAAGGKWYGGVYGWGFSVRVPQSGAMANRNTHALGFTGFMNAYMLTADDKYLDGWRRMTDRINAQAKVVDGRRLYPRMFGDKGWYAYTPSPYQTYAMEIYYLSQRDSDRKRMPGNGWIAYLEGKNPGFPEAAMRADLARIRKCVQGIYADTTTPDTRLADDPMPLNPCSVRSLIHTMLGGIHPRHQGNVLQCRVRYFDPVKRRAGVPDDVAALVEKMTADEVVLSLINLSPTRSREVVVQAGGYAEHHFEKVQVGEQSLDVNQRHVAVKLAPGAGQRLQFRVRRYAHQPTLAFPWNRNDR